MSELLTDDSNADDGMQLESVGRDADLAMYRAKERGRSRYEIFEVTMGARARLRLLSSRRAP